MLNAHRTEMQTYLNITCHAFSWLRFSFTKAPTGFAGKRPELFTKQRFLISHSPTSMADQWHLVQYFIKSSWKLTVQSIRKLQSLSNINYLAGCGGSTRHSPFAVETLIAVDFLHIPDARSITSLSLPQTVNTETSKKKFLAGNGYLGLGWIIFTFCLNCPGI